MKEMNFTGLIDKIVSEEELVFLFKHYLKIEATNLISVILLILG